VCRHFLGVWSWVEAGEAVVVVVVDNIVNVDGGCAGVVSGDVAGLWDARGGGAGRCGLLLACTAVLQVQGGSVDVPASLSGRGGSSLDAVCMTALTMAVEVICEAVWAVAGVVWVVVEVHVAVSVCTMASCKITAPWKHSRA
jgi:hypothetical protein